MDTKQMPHEGNAFLNYQKERTEKAYKIWVYEGKPDGEKEETCSVCGKSYKIKDRHYWEAFVYIFLKNTCDWQMSVRLDKVVCDWFHHAI